MTPGIQTWRNIGETCRRLRVTFWSPRRIRSSTEQTKAKRRMSRGISISPALPGRCRAVSAISMWTLLVAILLQRQLQPHPQQHQHPTGVNALLIGSTSRSVLHHHHYQLQQRRGTADRNSLTTSSPTSSLSFCYPRRKSERTESRLFESRYQQQSSSSSSSSSMVDEQRQGELRSSSTHQGATTTPIVVVKTEGTVPLTLPVSHQSTHNASWDRRITTTTNGIAPVSLLPDTDGEDDFDDNNDDLDTPQPTANGGYTHTSMSKAKISAANKGRSPWNKGQARPDDVRARISAGVRAKNRERFLQKLRDMGLTEDEYEAQKKEARRSRESERRHRKTEKGGYRPTDETRAKISAVLREKHARGEIKRAAVHPSKIRKGFTHSDETRRKISESLKRRWATDPAYREHITQSQSKASSRSETREKISQTLKERWQDPSFREAMMQKMEGRSSGRQSNVDGMSYREKISEAMKRKWQDEAYRDKTVKSIRRAAERRPDSRPKRPVRGTSSSGIGKGSSINSSSSSGSSGSSGDIETIGMHMIEPMTAQDIARRKGKKTKRKKVVKNAPVVAVEKVRPVITKRTIVLDDNDDDLDDLDFEESDDIAKVLSSGSSRTSNRGNKQSTTIADTSSTHSTLKTRTPATKKKKEEKTEKEPDGSVSRLKEERRDLFDLLYGDEDNLKSDDDDDDDGGVSGYDGIVSLKNKVKMMSFGDEDLDSFDPYGLDDY